MKWRAVQDSNLWPSAPEACPPTLQGAATLCNPAEPLETAGPVRGGILQPDACLPRIHAPAVPQDALEDALGRALRAYAGRRDAELRQALEDALRALGGVA